MRWGFILGEREGEGGREGRERGGREGEVGERAVSEGEGKGRGREGKGKGRREGKGEKRENIEKLCNTLKA